MVTKLEEYLDIFHARISTTSSSAPKSIDPLLGRSTPTRSSASASTTRCTWASPTPGRRRRDDPLRRPAAHLLASGIGDTIRISYASDPSTK
jgi:hypothetical protein